MAQPTGRLEPRAGEPNYDYDGSQRLAARTTASGHVLAEPLPYEFATDRDRDAFMERWRREPSSHRVAEFNVDGFNMTHIGFEDVAVYTKEDRRHIWRVVAIILSAFVACVLAARWLS